MIYKIKNAVPRSWKQIYHLALAWLAVLVYRNPSKKLIVIGVTGTNGKSTTSLMIAHALEVGGNKTGATTTAQVKIGKEVHDNTSKMTMPGRFALQRLLREMVKAGCTYAVLETSSQGLEQHRHKGVNYDVAIFTNLTPEHIEAHGDFEAYKKAKIKLFKYTAKSSHKKIDGKEVLKIAVLNAGDKHAADFEVAGFDKVVWFGKGSKYEPMKVKDSLDGVSFKVGKDLVKLKTPGLPNTWNASAAIATADVLGVPRAKSIAALGKMNPLPGRFEVINEGQPWSVLVDYAAEPVALGHLYQAAQAYPHKRLIQVIGSCGGGRDEARRPILGKLSGKLADVVIVTNEDPYDDDPIEIINSVAKGAKDAGKKEGKDLFLIEDRKEAINKAMQIAKPKDLVLLTGKGNEQWICVAGGVKLPWDEREVAREAIRAAMLQ